jgi:hypothetical protein
MSLSASLLKSPWARHLLSLLLGVALGVFCHYLLFRLSLPMQPFIYVAF